MLRALLTGKDSFCTKEVIWLLDRVDDLSQYRNSFVHTAVLPDLETGVYGPNRYASKAKYAEKLATIAKDNLFIPLMNDIDLLEGYARSLDWHLMHDELLPPETLPSRPTLTISPGQAQGSKKKLHPDKKTKHRPPPQS